MSPIYVGFLRFATQTFQIYRRKPRGSPPPSTAWYSRGLSRHSRRSLGCHTPTRTGVGILFVLFKFNCTIRVIVRYGAHLTRSDALDDEEALHRVESYPTAVDVIGPAYYPAPRALLRAEEADPSIGAQTLT